MADPVSVVVGATRIWLMVKPIRRFRKWRNKRRALKGLDTIADGGDDEMTQYNKLIGAVVGAILGLAASKVPFLVFLADPELQAQITMLIGTMIGTYFAPKNAEPA